MENQTIKNTNEVEKQQKNDVKRLVEWISKNWNEWKMLCNPAISGADERFQRREWAMAARKLAKAGFSDLVLVFMTKCYYMGGEARQVIESAVMRRLFLTWDENTIDEFIDYINKIDNWDARELPISEQNKAAVEEIQKNKLERWLNPKINI